MKRTIGRDDGKQGGKEELYPHKTQPLTHLEIRREQCSYEQVDVLGAEAQAELGKVHVKKVRRLDFRADVILPIEGGHSDGRFGIKEGDVVTCSSIHVSLLRGGRKDILSEALG